MEPSIATTSKGVKLINFNIPHQMIFDDGTVLKGVNRFQYEVYPEKTTKENLATDLFVLFLHTNIKGIFREVEKLLMSYYHSDDRTNTVILLDNKTCELYYAYRDKLNVSCYTGCIVASPINAPNSSEPAQGDISDNRRFVHNQFKTYV